MTVSAFAARHILAPKPPPPRPSLPVAGSAAWYDASQITGQADGSALATWADLSGNGHTLTQASPASQPIYYSSTAANLVNGLPAVSFNGGPGIASAPFAAPLSQPFTICCVWNTTAISGAYNYAIDSDSALLGIGSGVFAIWATGGFVGNAGGSVGLHQHIGVYDGASSAIYTDGALGATGSPGGGNLTMLDLGAGAQHGGAAHGLIPEVIVYPFALTSPQMTSIHDYLKTKWGTP